VVDDPTGRPGWLGFARVRARAVRLFGFVWYGLTLRAGRTRNSPIGNGQANPAGVFYCVITDGPRIYAVLPEFSTGGGTHATFVQFTDGRPHLALFQGYRILTFDGMPEDANVILIANGSGIAPYVSMLSTDLTFLRQRSVVLVHGVRHSYDLGYRSVFTSMQRLRTNFTYLPIVSRPHEEPVPWKGATGRVQELWPKRRDRTRVGLSTESGEHPYIFVRQSRDDRSDDRDVSSGEIPGAHPEEARADPFREVLGSEGRGSPACAIRRISHSRCHCGRVTMTKPLS